MSSPQINNDIVTLNNGVKIPLVGLGTWQSENGEAKKATLIALKNGYRHIDTAAIYGNEDEVGEAIKESGVKREEIFVTTKLWNTAHKDPESALETSLKKLQLDYVDLYLIHWPVTQDPETKKVVPDYNFVDAYKKLQHIYKNTKKVRAIGVSNFTIKQLEELLGDKEVDVVPAVNQIEAHPLLQQPELYDYLKSKKIYIEAYSPLGSTGAPVGKSPTVTKLAEKYNVDSATILISWAVQRDTIVLPKSVTESRIISNLKTVKLDKADFDALNDITKHEKPVRVNKFSLHDFGDGL